MVKRILFFGFILIWIGCKEPAVNEPDILIEKQVMVDILYDLSLLEAMKYQSLSPLENYNLNPSQYIFKKYKIDSLQLAQNNRYYAADYKGYKKMNDQIQARLDKNRTSIEALIKKQKSKAIAIEKAKSKLKKRSDTLVKIKKEEKVL